MNFSEQNKAKAAEIIAHYPETKKKSAMLPLLHIAQDQNNGWLSVEAMDHVAEILKLKPIEVYEVATFYSMYNLKPVGKYVFEEVLKYFVMKHFPDPVPILFAKTL